MTEFLGLWWAKLILINKKRILPATFLYLIVRPVGQMIISKSFRDQNGCQTFLDLFDSAQVKICWAFTMITDFFISTPLFIFFILFDKYGEDPMKRSLYNHLMSQTAYTVILQTLFYAPTSAWRVYIGPLNSFAADLNTFIVNTSLIWTLIGHSEALISRYAKIL